MNVDGKSQSYMEVVNKNGESYKEIPVDEEGNYGVLDNIAGYRLYDWITKDGDMYEVNQYADGEDNTIVEAAKYPKSFAEYNQSRKYLYLDKLLSSFYEYKEGEDNTLDLGDGSHKYKTYSCKLDSETIKELLAIDTYELYNCVIKDYPDNKNVKQLCEYYLRDLEMDLTFSEANFVIGIYDDMIRYYELEVGGLGTRLYFSKALVPVEDDKFEYRETPDLKDAKDFVEVELQEDADYVAKFDSYDDAMKALKEKTYSDNLDSNLYDNSDTDNSSKDENTEEGK